MVSTPDEEQRRPGEGVTNYLLRVFPIRRRRLYRALLEARRGGDKAEIEAAQTVLDALDRQKLA